MTAVARTLARLLAPAWSGTAPLPPAEEFARCALSCTERLGLATPSAVVEDADPDPRELVWWLLAMATPTYRRELEGTPPVDPALVARLGGLLEGRPALAAEHAQLHIDIASVARRATVVSERLRVAPGPVLAVGDDDCVSVALAVLGVDRICVVDVDERVLDFVAAAGRSVGREVRIGCVDVFEDPPPRPWHGAFSAIVTDPIRSREPCLAFLEYGARCLGVSGAAGLFWADHPAWNLEVDGVLAELRRLGLTVAVCHEDWHRYPLGPEWLGDLTEKARAVGVDPGWLVRLAEAVAGWSHLYELRRA
ncbi:MAG: bis-aminopropyl spermidine synthase family protein [Polyangiaceae bacterium]|nr:bis-aminopropyl spermidine synthase family protein [Polyangiaceae bacterium]